MDRKSCIDKIFTFAELEASPTVKPCDLVRTFDDYVQSGAALNADVVIGIIQKSPVRIEHLGAIGEGVSIGLNDQNRRGFPIEAEQYARIGSFISQRMTEMARDQR